MGHLTEMGDHRVGSGSSSRLPRFAAAPDQDAAREIGPRCRCPEIARQCGAAVRQERPSGKPGGLFLLVAWNLGPEPRGGAAVGIAAGLLERSDTLLNQRK